MALFGELAVFSQRNPYRLGLKVEISVHQRRMAGGMASERAFQNRSNRDVSWNFEQLVSFPFPNLCYINVVISNTF